MFEYKSMIKLLSGSQWPFLSKNDSTDKIQLDEKVTN